MNKQTKRSRMLKAAKHKARVRNAAKRHGARGAYLRDQSALKASVVALSEVSDD